MPTITVIKHRVHEPFILDAIEGLRLSYGSGSKMDSVLEGDQLIIGAEDEKRCRTNILVGGGEEKFIRCIPVSVFIQAPLRWWFDMDTYKVATTKQSSSLMHFLKRHGHFTRAHFTETTDDRLIALANEKFDSWVASGARRNFTSREWEELQDAIGRGYLYTAQWYGCYAVLRNAYFQRRHHRQGEWRIFCEWITTLPHSWMITCEKVSKHAKD